MRTAFLVPVKGFHVAKGRLASVLSPAHRSHLARSLAGRVLAAVSDFDVFVACDDDDVRRWADEAGATPLWGPRLGLNGAIDDGVERLRGEGFDHVVVTHADLPHPDGLVRVARPDTVTLVPDRHRDGTNVLSFPVSHPITASYGAQSFRRHEAAARTRGDVAVEIRPDPLLGLDVDTPTDLQHPRIAPVIRQVLTS